jgi:hypothetical protein
MIMMNSQGALGGIKSRINSSSYETFRIGNKDASKRSLRCRKAGTALESKAKIKGGGGNIH